MWSCTSSLRVFLTKRASPQQSQANAVNPTLPAFEQGAWSPSQASHVHHPSIVGTKRDFEPVVAAPRAVDKIPTTTIDPAHVPKSPISEESLSFLQVMRWPELRLVPVLILMSTVTACAGAAGDRPRVSVF